MASVVENPKLCTTCMAPDCELKCPCKQVYYCGRACQKRDWNRHKNKCAIALANNVKKAKKEHGKQDVAVADARKEAGHGHVQEGRYGLAEQCYLEARRVYLAAQGEEHFNMAEIDMELGQLYYFQGRHEESLEILTRALRIFRLTVDNSPWVASCLGQIGRTLQSQGRLDEALKRLKEARGIFNATIGAEQPAVAKILGDMGHCYRMQGKIEKSIELHTEALRIKRITCGDDSEEVCVSLSNLAQLMSGQGMFAEAMELFEKSLEVTRRLHGEKHSQVGSQLNNIANILADQGQHDDALKMYKKSLKIARRTHRDDDHVDVADTLLNIATVLQDQEKFGEALPVFEETLGIYNRVNGIDCRQNAKVLRGIALCKGALQDMEGALVNIREAVRISELRGGPGDEDLTENVRLLRELESIMG
jgi:tetratricopeptide (TPR) repeat protein